ncbi:MAG: NAD-dependent DNA ligase LigA [Treponema sp.]|nr:NAD-dependent DNA ligase LigA [Treponema sp.]
MDLFDLEAETKTNNNLKRIRELEKLIVKYQKSYYNGEAEIEDSEFDKLWDELKDLDPSNKILQKIGADSGNFEKAGHIMPMGSQEKAADPESFLAWALKHVYPEYLVEYKLDGASLELQYQNGLLVKAVTRGDGTIGDDITSNAKKMSGVSVKLLNDGTPVNFTGGIRGEVIMTHDVHKRLYSDKANCRNAANGLMKKKEGTGCENLCLIVYDALSTDGQSFFNDEEEKINWLKQLGFNTSPLKICKTPQDVIDYRAEVMEKRNALDYDIDGLVIKERKINLEDASRARPDHQIAFKFSLEEAVSVLREVEWSQSGSTYTPVGIFDPVQLAGTTVKRASLANPDTLRALDIKIGSHIVVVKRGEIIPKIIQVVKGEGDSFSEIQFPDTCEVCGTKLVDSGSRLYCPEKNCRKRIIHRIYKWIECVDIRDMGEALVQALFNDKKINSIKDIYLLTENDLVPYFLNNESQEKVSAGEKVSLGARKVYNSIQSHKEVSLTAFIAGFDIEGMGETMIEKLVDAGFTSVDKLLEATVQDFEKVYMFAQITAQTLFEGLQENKEEILSLINDGLVTVKEISEGKLTGMSFCFTGELKQMKRQDAEKLVKENGGSCKSSVTKDLSYLVTNDTESGSSKNVKAAKLGIRVITEEQFYSLLK